MGEGWERVMSGQDDLLKNRLTANADFQQLSLRAGLEVTPATK
jgi:hypothetical protein